MIVVNPDGNVKFSTDGGKVTSVLLFETTVVVATVVITVVVVGIVGIVVGVVVDVDNCVFVIGDDDVVVGVVVVVVVVVTRVVVVVVVVGACVVVTVGMLVFVVVVVVDDAVNAIVVVGCVSVTVFVTVDGDVNKFKVVAAVAVVVAVVVAPVTIVVDASGVVASLVTVLVVAVVISLESVADTLLDVNEFVVVVFATAMSPVRAAGAQDMPSTDACQSQTYAATSCLSTTTVRSFRVYRQCLTACRRRAKQVSCKTEWCFECAPTIRHEHRHVAGAPLHAASVMKKPIAHSDVASPRASITAKPSTSAKLISRLDTCAPIEATPRKHKV